MSETQYCQECGEKLHGRIDKRFCNDACRNAFNNRKNAHLNAERRRINRILARNYRILTQLNPTGKTTLAREVLLRQGFDFEFFTSLYETRKGHRYHFVYDQGYLELAEHRVVLVRRES